MTKSFEVLRQKMSPERRAENEANAREVIAEIALQELRKSFNVTQEELAKLMEVKQASLSKFERQGDMYISTLSRFIDALGGRLKLIASFPDKDVLLKPLAEEK